MPAMLNSLAKLFSAPKKRIAGKTVTRRGTHRRAAQSLELQSLELQSLEPRLALAITATIDPTTTGFFAYRLTIDDTVNVVNGSNDGNTAGNGRDLYLQAGSDTQDFFLVADNPSFNNAARLAVGTPTGVCTTIAVVSASQTGSPQSFTVFASSRIPSQRLIVDLGPANSRISINSRWDAKDGSATDQYKDYGGTFNAGQIALYGTDIAVNSDISTSSRFTVNWARQQSGFTTPTERLDINAAVTAPNVLVQIDGTSTALASMRVSEAGSIISDSKGSAGFYSNYANISVLGTVNIPTQTYVLRAADSLQQYGFTTRSAGTGLQVGKIQGSSVSVTMGQPKGGTVDLATAVDRFQYQTGLTDQSTPLNYAVSVVNDASLTVDAVGGSSGPVSIASKAGDLTIKGDAVRTGGGLSLAAAKGTLSVKGSITTANGDISL